MSRILYLPNSKCQQRQLEKPNFLAYPVLLAMEATKRRNDGDEVHWDEQETYHYEALDTLTSSTFVTRPDYDKVITEPEGLPFLFLPHPDRLLTKALDKKYQKNGNFKFTPATYIQSAKGCWWSRCSFCVENNVSYQVRPVEDVLEEIGECIDLGFREIFDDSATFPDSLWWREFCLGMIERGYNEKVKIDCNYRFSDEWYTYKETLLRGEFELMKKAGFRMLLFGLESANQYTLYKINKGVSNETFIPTCKIASECGLDCHIATMFGYSWEDDRDALRTLQLVWWLLKKGYAKTAQASLYSPNGNERHRKYIRRIYNVGANPEFWWRKLLDIHNKDDLKYLWKQIKAGIQDCLIETEQK